LTLATTAKSEAVRLNAWTTIARVMGLTKETVDALQGVNIVIKTGGGAPVKVGIMASSAPKTPPGPVSVIK
jgi:hypothetical protein